MFGKHTFQNKERKTFKHHPHGITLPTLSREAIDGKRMYMTPGGVAYPSITTVLGVMDKSGLHAWRKRVGEAEANRISSTAARRGTAVHKLAEDYLDNLDDWSANAQPANLFMFNSIKEVLDKHVNNVWFQEVYLYSDKLKTAGQVDCIGEWDGELAVIDFKTARNPKEEEHILSYFIQVCFYAAAFFEMTSVPIKKGVILIAVEGHEPQQFIFNVSDYLPHFAAVRRKYKELKE